MAEIVSLNTFVLFNISNAPTDVALAFSLGQPYFGLVINKLLKPKFFKDLADAPIFSQVVVLLK